MRVERGQIAWGTAAFGTWTFTILLALYAYYEDGPGAVGLAVAVRLLPAALMAPVVARVTGGRSPRTVFVASALLGFALLEAIAFIVWLDVSFAAVLGLAAVFNVATSPYRPAQPALLGRDAFDYAGVLAGGVTAAVLATVAGLDVCFAVCGIAFAAVAAIAWALPAEAEAAAEAGAAAEPAAAEPAAPADADPRWLLGLFAGGALIQSMLEVLLVIAALELLGMGQGGLGWLRAASAVGGLLVCLAVARRVDSLPMARRVDSLPMARRVDSLPLAHRVALGWALAGVALGVVGAVRDPLPALILLVLLGGGYALGETGLMTITRRSGRAGTSEDLIYAAARAAGALLAAWLATELGDEQALLATAVLLPALALAAFYAIHTAEATSRSDAAATAAAPLPLAPE